MKLIAMKLRLNPLRHRPSWLTLPLLGAAALAVAAAAFHFGVVRPGQIELQSLQQKIVAAQLSHRLAHVASSAESPRLQLVRFYKSFPRMSYAPNWLGRIHAAAEANHLELPRGEYRLLRTKPQLTEYQITLPLEGSYPDIRHFLDTVLADLTSVSLDQVTFERQKIGEAAVKVTVRLTLYLRDG